MRIISYHTSKSEDLEYFSNAVRDADLTKIARANTYMHHVEVTRVALSVIGKCQFKESEFKYLANTAGFRVQSISKLISIAPLLYSFKDGVLTLKNLEPAFQYVKDRRRKGTVGGNMKSYNSKVKAYEESKEVEPTSKEVDAMIKEFMSPDELHGYRNEEHKEYLEKHSSKHSKLTLDPIKAPFEDVPEAIFSLLDTTTITITPASNKDTLEELQTAKLNNENNEELTITKTIDMPTEYAKKSTVKGTTEYIEKVADGSTKREQDYAFKRESPKSVYDREVVANTYVETFTDEMYQSAVDRKLYPHQVVDAINAKAGNNSLIDYSTFKLEKTWKRLTNWRGMPVIEL